MKTKFIILFTLITLIFINKSFSCSPVLRLTTEETIIRSHAIVIATVVDFIKPGIRENETDILFEIDEVIYGELKDNYIKFEGKIVSKSLSNKGIVPYKNGRRRSSGGQCSARDYEYAGTYLLMLKNKSPYWSAYNPVNEKITGSLDPWVTWVKGFVAGRKSMRQNNNKIN